MSSRGDTGTRLWPVSGDPADYDEIRDGDLLSLVGLAQLTESANAFEAH